MRHELPGGGHALFTARVEGNLSSVGGVEAEHGLHAREQLCRQIDVEHLLRGYQVHGTTVQLATGLRAQQRARRGNQAWGRSRRRKPPPRPSTRFGGSAELEADGQATARGIGAIVLTADCLPIAVAGDGAVAMIHAGWRGLAGGVIERGVRALRELGARRRAERGDRAGRGRLLLRGRRGGARGASRRWPGRGAGATPT